MMAAKISLDYNSLSLAQTVKNSLGPDNHMVESQGMQITAHLRGRTLNIAISRCPRVETLQATLDDIFRCVRAAEETISITHERSRLQMRKDKRFK
ncbi:MAG TPA: KEOPS complex subunit Pcc1 [Candidatus Bathyarchaeia archaeon]|nr:KEOPS complex subunit Pcc1 [Candidatus Bathyarchaeia archaeon]